MVQQCNGSVIRRRIAAECMIASPEDSRMPSVVWMRLHKACGLIHSPRRLMLVYSPRARQHETVAIVVPLSLPNRSRSPVTFSPRPRLPECILAIGPRIVSRVIARQVGDI